jgi:zeta-carotene desaturase
MAKKVIIIGGGAAGLSAGVKLAVEGHEVRLFESKPFLGGRLYSFVEPATGDIVDNGQHIMAGFYYNTFKLLTMLETSHLVKLQNNLEIDFFEKGPKHFRFKCLSMPVPFALMWGLFSYPKFNKRDLIKLMKMKKSADKSLTAAQWLEKLNISEESIYSFFKPLVLATLNAGVEKVSAIIFRDMLNTIFDAKSREAVLAFPKVGLSKIVADPAGEFIKKRGGQINLCTQIKEIVLEGGRVSGVVDFNDQKYSADAYICALPPDNLYNILPGGENHYLKEWSYSPIVAVNLWFDRSVMDQPMIGMLDSPFHWCFDKSKLFGSDKKHPYISFIISAANEAAEWTKDKLIDMAMSEIKTYLPKISGARLVHSQVIKEKKATVLITPEALSLREKPRSPWENFFVAGDWTDTGLPATIESAVKSGFVAADLVCTSTGSARTESTARHSRGGGNLERGFL